MRMRKLGALEVSELGFGILSFASTYGQAPEKAESIRVIRGAHDLGVTLFDTAEVYGPWTNEALVGEALAPVRNEVVIATKFGFDALGLFRRLAVGQSQAQGPKAEFGHLQGTQLSHAHVATPIEPDGTSAVSGAGRRR